MEVIEVKADIKILKTIEVILTAVNDAEVAAVIKLMKPINGHNKLLRMEHNDVDFVVGEFGRFRTGLVCTDPGAAGLNAAYKSIDNALSTKEVRPSLVISVGMGFGANKKEQKLGDVMVSKYIDDYRTIKANRAGNVIFRTPQRIADEILVDKFKNKFSEWRKKRGPDDWCKVIIGPILSAGMLMNNKEMKDMILDAGREAIGGEMEGAAIFEAIDACKFEPKPKRILVKAICDWADGTKDDDMHEFAAEAAAEYVHHHLSKETFFDKFSRKETSQPVPHDQPTASKPPKLAAKPTIDELISSEGKDGKELRIIDSLAANESYKLKDFARLLLKESGLVQKLKKNNKNDDDFIREVLEEWLSKSDRDTTAEPRTWEALADTIEKAGLPGILADSIRKVFC